MSVPLATYRWQLAPPFDFREAETALDYLSRLGVSHVYASPVFKARSGSRHGYDVVDVDRINPELGGEEDFAFLVTAARSRGLGWIQDIVPNHMAFDRENEMLMDVLENGPASPHRDVFDVDWEHPDTSMHGRLLAPFLGSFFGQALENGEIRLEYHPEGFTVHYYDLAFPLSLDTYPLVLGHDMVAFQERLGSDHPDAVNYLGVLYILRNLPDARDPYGRRVQASFAKRSLWNLYRSNDDVRDFVDDTVRLFNGTTGAPESFNLLEDLLAHQYYRLAFWKVAAEEINYRRFFNISDLICVRVENESVFGRTHGKLFEFIDRGLIDGLRVDHIDGLYDPLAYLRRLRQKLGENGYLVVEKILEPVESLPRSWPVQGTTGYDFLNRLNQVFCSAPKARELNRVYTAFTGLESAYHNLVTDKKRLIIGKEMAGEVDNLARLMKTLASNDRFAGDVTLYGAKRALVEILAQFPVYRTYVREENLAAEDRRWIDLALERSRLSNPGLANEFRFIERFLRLEFEDWLPWEIRNGWVHLVMAFQQLSGPLMAKGFEDTTLYIYNRLLSLNEVGGSPERVGLHPEKFHRFIRSRQSAWPLAMNATATHDTKRGEDIRARLHVVSELPREWEARLKEWHRLNRPLRRRVGGSPAPDANDEYFLYQTLLGAWPLDEPGPDFAPRIRAYLVKAVREAKVHTAWLKPDTDYEDAFVGFFDALLQPEHGFLERFLPFCRRIAHHGMINSLAQVLIKVAAPGVPDFYQGTELWDFSLVDPDNRRPVDYGLRMRLLSGIDRGTRDDPAALAAELLGAPGDGRVKMFVIRQALAARRAAPDLFLRGAYLPLAPAGACRGNVLAFARRIGGDWALAVVPRLTAVLVPEGEWPMGEAVWRDTRLTLPAGMPGEWTCALTGRKVSGQGALPVAAALDRFPVALLIGRA